MGSFPSQAPPRLTQVLPLKFSTEDPVLLFPVLCSARLVRVLSMYNDRYTLSDHSPFAPPPHSLTLRSAQCPLENFDDVLGLLENFKISVCRKMTDEPSAACECTPTSQTREAR